MDRCAVFVDAGYLHESAKTLLLGGHPGATVRAKATLLVREIAALAVAQTDLPLLRIYWYAAAPNRNPYPDQRELASLQDIKLRLGNLRERAGGRMVQKGVDAELHADMTGLARNRGAVDFVLLSGDEDLLRAVDEVQSYGVRVHLWGVEAGPDGGNQSLELIAAADRRHVLEEAWIRNVFAILEPPRPDSPTAAPPTLAVGPAAPAPDVVAAPAGGDAVLPASPAPHPPAPNRDEAIPPAPQPDDAGAPGTTEVRPASAADVSGSGVGGPNGHHGPLGSGESAEPQARPELLPPLSGGIPKPSDIRPRPLPAPLRPPASTMIYTASPGRSGYSPHPDYAFYRLSDLTTQAEQYADSAEDEAMAYDAIAVGKVYARRWLSRATSEAASLLSVQYPTIPKTIDAELLRYAVNRGVDTWTSETDKFAVRQGFWAEVRIAGQREAGEHHP
ncbi:MAG: NYN domain-containing protein [Candidatus Nanopelagicales bacterium]